MKIKISNIGPIHKFEIDLAKKLTMIYGKNNIGKSYAISVVYMVLKALPKFYSRTKLEEKVATYLNRINPFQEFEFLVLRFLIVFLRETFASEFKNYLVSSYGTLQGVKNALDKTESSKVEIKTRAFTFIYTLEDNKSGKDQGIHIYKKSGILKSRITSNPVDILNECVDLIAMFQNEVQTYNTTFNYLPAVRSGIYLGYSNFGAMIAKLNQYQNQIGQIGFQLPNTTLPVSDFFAKIAEVSHRGPLAQYSEIVDKFEKKLLDGRVEIDKESGKIRYFSHQLQRAFDLSQVSSMVSELSIVTSYIKYILRDDAVVDLTDPEVSFIFGIRPMVFIEEPEAHLHPEAQIVLMELLVDLTNSGVHLVITTHSDFMLNCLGNQLLARKIKSQQVGSLHLSRTEHGSIILKDMYANSDGIKDQNFYEATDTLYRERIRLNEEKNYRLSRKNKRL